MNKAEAPNKGFGFSRMIYTSYNEKNPQQGVIMFQNKIASTKAYIQTHKKTVVLGALAATLIVTQHKGIKSLNNFLKENDMFDAYYLPE